MMVHPNYIDTISALSASTVAFSTWRQWWSVTFRKAWADGSGVLERLSDILERSRQRRRLLAMDDRMLKDIGLNRADAWAEARKPGWKA